MFNWPIFTAIVLLTLIISFVEYKNQKGNVKSVFVLVLGIAISVLTGFINTDVSDDATSKTTPTATLTGEASFFSSPIATFTPYVSSSSIITTPSISSYRTPFTPTALPSDTPSPIINTADDSYWYLGNDGRLYLQCKVVDASATYHITGINNATGQRSATWSLLAIENFGEAEGLAISHFLLDASPGEYTIEVKSSAGVTLKSPAPIKVSHCTLNISPTYAYFQDDRIIVTGSFPVGYYAARYKNSVEGEWTGGSKYISSESEIILWGWDTDNAVSLLYYTDQRITDDSAYITFNDKWTDYISIQ